MDLFILPLFLILLKFAAANFFSLSFSLFDPLMGLMVVYTFFHSLDTRTVFLYAIVCGLLREIFSCDVFGIYLISYLGSAFTVACVMRLVYRDNWLFVFPVVFFGTFFCNALTYILRPLLGGILPAGQSGLFFIKNLIEACGTTLFIYPLYRWAKKCDLKLIR